jgi:hypothetical protein
VSAPDVPLWLACGGTPAFAVLAVTELARISRGRVTSADILGVAFAFYFGLLAVIGWAVLAIGAIR